MRHLGVIFGNAKKWQAFVVVSLGLALAGCFEASHHQAAVESAKIGASTYTPSVLVEPGNEARYQKVLALCRQAAKNRQLTAAQTAELRAQTGMADSAVQGALGGLAETMFSDGDIGGSMVGGIMSGLIGAAVREGGKGTVATAAATRAALLKCLRVTSRGGKLWAVLE